VRIPLGDLDLVVEARLPGLHPRVLWRFGPATPRPRPLPAALPAAVSSNPNLKDVTVVAALQADKKFSFQLGGKDEVGNPVPLGSTPPTLTLDRDDIVTLTIGEDGFSGEIAATGTLGTAVLSLVGVTDAGVTYRDSQAIEVVPGDVATVTWTFGEPEEVTPDV
jgi:hypothetical protein